MEPCVWHACIDPPLPEGKGLKHDWNPAVPVEFGDTVFYSCARENLYFEHDRDFAGFTLKCEDDGSFEDMADEDWLKCVPSKTITINPFYDIDKA